MNSLSTPALAQSLRRQVVQMAHRARGSHVGTCLSVADILAVLFNDIMTFDANDPKMAHRDRLFVSKGHAAAIVYAVLAEKGFFPKDWLENYHLKGSPLLGHVSHYVPGVEFSTGSLGHGLSVACGNALFAKRNGEDWRSFVLLGDGEMNEGSNFEAMMFAAHHKLDSLVAIVDYNKLQGFGRNDDVLSLEPFGAKFEAFGWHSIEIDGHDINALKDALSYRPQDKPLGIIAHTIKGKGVSFMENELLWHYRPPSDEELARALDELNASEAECRS